MSTFIPPQPLHPLISLAKMTIPLYVGMAHHLRVVVDDATIEIFRRVEDSPVLICPNHPAPQDPLAVFGLSGRVKSEFYYMTAREVFMNHPSLRSIWLEWLGCYSVSRGLADRNSLRATKRLLMTGHEKVVMFPEGEITHQNAVLARFEHGPAQIALDVSKARERTRINEPLFLVPLAIIYRFDSDHAEELMNTLIQIESAFDGVHPEMPTHLRIYNCFLSLLEAEESHHRLKKAGTFEERLQRFMEHGVTELEVEMTSEPYRGEVIDRLHRLKSILVRERFDNKHEPDESSIQWYRRIRRLTRLMDVTARAFHAGLSQEEQAELLTILSWEVFNTDILPNFQRTAYVSAAEPIDVTEWRRVNVDGGVNELTNELRNRIAAKIEIMMAG